MVYYGGNTGMQHCVQVVSGKSNVNISNKSNQRNQ